VSGPRERLKLRERGDQLSGARGIEHGLNDWTTALYGDPDADQPRGGACVNYDASAISGIDRATVPVGMSL